MALKGPVNNNFASKIFNNKISRQIFLVNFCSIKARLPWQSKWGSHRRDDVLSPFLFLSGHLIHTSAHLLIICEKIPQPIL